MPELNSVFNAADVTVEWDPTVMSYTSADFSTGLFGSGTATPVGSNQLNIHVSSGSNVTVNPLNDIVKLTFTLLKPGHSALAVVHSDFTMSGPQPAYMIPFQGEVKAYLGDFANSTDQTSGDGIVDFNDLFPWSISYWSGTEGFPGGMTNYKRKFDVGPTQDAYVFSLPVPDSKIDFEDLLIFSIVYGKSQSNTLPKLPALSPDAVEVSLGKPAIVGNETRIPVTVGGGVTDIRGMKIEVEGAFGSFVGAAKGGLLNSYETPTMVMARADGRKVFVDLAVMGLDAPGINRSGDVVWLRFTGRPMVRLTVADARSSGNASLNTMKKKGEGEAVPTTYVLEQNYPNPFNPTTTIEYDIPSTGKVTLEIYNIIGERVRTLVNDVQDAGVYQVVWDGRDESRNTVATGVYLYRVHAGNFNSVKKMLLMK